MLDVDLDNFIGGHIASVLDDDRDHDRVTWLVLRLVELEARVFERGITEPYMRACVGSFVEFDSHTEHPKRKHTYGQ